MLGRDTERAKENFINRSKNRRRKTLKDKMLKENKNTTKTEKGSAENTGKREKEQEKEEFWEERQREKMWFKSISRDSVSSNKSPPCFHLRSRKQKAT